MRRSLDDEDVKVALDEELVVGAEGGGPGGGGPPSLPEPDVDPLAMLDNWLRSVARVSEIATPLRSVVAEVELVGCVPAVAPEEPPEVEVLAELAAFCRSN